MSVGVCLGLGALKINPETASDVAGCATSDWVECTCILLSARSGTMLALRSLQLFRFSFVISMPLAAVCLNHSLAQVRPECASHQGPLRCLTCGSHWQLHTMKKGKRVGLCSWFQSERPRMGI